MTRVTVLGSTGMLGAMMVEVLASTRELQVIATGRSREPFAAGVEWRALDAETADEASVRAAIAGSSWVVNCIGIIKTYIHDDNAVEVERAVRVNGLFPHLLARAAAAEGARVLQIATDCVYSGSKGLYRERDLHDALDVYGKTKSLGEVPLPGFHSLRASIIGPERKGFFSLLEWFLGQPIGARVKGFTNHHWNGVTTLHFARLCRGIITNALDLPRLQHVIPAQTLSKHEMLSCFAKAYRREDIVIEPMEASPIDRTLATENGALNAQLWKCAGHETPPSVPAMIDEMAAHTFSWRGRR